MASNRLSLPLSDVFDVTISASAQSVVSPIFNQGLIVGTSTVIPSHGGGGEEGVRCRVYSSLEGILLDGFTTEDEEYIAASQYFGQAPAAQFCWIGRWDLTAVGSAEPTSGHLGTGYAAGDRVLLSGSGGGGAVIEINVVGDGGTVTSFEFLDAGTAASIETGVTTTAQTGSGTGLEVDILTIGESALQAVSACRAAAPAWWGCFVCGIENDDIESVADFAQAIQPPMCLFYNTDDADVLDNVADNVAATLQASSYSRVFGIYSTTQSGAAPNNAYIAAGAMGLAMGLNTGLANSYFTMKFKRIIGSIPESLTQDQVASLESLNINVYVYYASGSFQWLEQGVCPDGEFLDQILNEDMLTSDIAISLANLLVSAPSIPQTNAGQALLINVVSGACNRAAIRGFIAGGIWTNASINYSAQNGQALPNGYLVSSPPYSTVSQANLAARQAAPIYVAIIEAGAVHFASIAVAVQL